MSNHEVRIEMMGMQKKSFDETIKGRGKGKIWLEQRQRKKEKKIGQIFLLNFRPQVVLSPCEGEQEGSRDDLHVFMNNAHTRAIYLEIFFRCMYIMCYRFQFSNLWFLFPLNSSFLSLPKEDTSKNVSS